MDVWTLDQKQQQTDKNIDSLERRLKHIEEYLGKLNDKLSIINKASDAAVSNKKDKPSRVRTKRPTAKKS